MAKGTRGGKRTTSVTSQAMAASVQIKPVQVVIPTPQQVAAGNITPKGGVPFDKFEKMTDDEKAQVILDSMGCNTPSFLDDSYLQKLCFFTGMKEKPQIVDEATLAAMPGKDLWRSVQDFYSKPSDTYVSAQGKKHKGNDVFHSAKEICLQIMKGDYTMFADMGGTAHGRAIYFDTSKGSYNKLGKNNAILHAKFAKGAVIKSEDYVNTALSREISSGSKLGKVLNKINNTRDYASAKSIYCLAKGIDGYVAWNGYHMIVNRGALVVSKKIQ